MRKLTIIGISILSVFILCSLSYQPIIADTPIETITQVKETKVSNLDADELKELYNRMIELKSQSKDDCGCGDAFWWNPPIICGILLLICGFGYVLVNLWDGWSIDPLLMLVAMLGIAIATFAMTLAGFLFCNWVP